MKIYVLLLLVFTFQISELKSQTITDFDGNTYNTIQLGTQMWMKENLKATHFSNGDLIPTSLTPVNNDSTSIYQWSYNDDSSNITIYGRLYSWFAVSDNRNVCPAGWHVPSDTEWTTLSDFLGGDSIAGDKMKETGISHWAATNMTVTNSSGFTGLPGGFRGNPSGYNSLYTLGSFWASNLWGSNVFPRGYVFNLKSNASTLEQTVAVANCGLSVRCMKEASTNIRTQFPENKIRIFPNPTREILNISFEVSGDFKAAIFDITGNIVFQKQLNDKVNTIDLNFLHKGIYVIKVAGTNFNVEEKLIIHRD